MSEHESKQNAAAEESGASTVRDGNAARATAEGGAAGARGRGTVVVEIPAPQGLLGLAPIISVLLLAAAWGVVGIGYLCVPGSVAGAVLALACAAMNLGSGSIAQPALCLGIALACAGLCLPLWRGCQAGRRRGFIVGTDDYLVKPIDAQEMVLRVRALLRRSQIAFERRLRIGEVELNYDALTVSRPGTSLTLPPKEFYLLFKLLAYPDQIFTRAQLMEEVWESRYIEDASTVNVHVNRLRKRFAGWPEFEIVTVRGIGYKAVRHDG